MYQVALAAQECVTFHWPLNEVVVSGVERYQRRVGLICAGLDRYLDNTWPHPERGPKRPWGFCFSSKYWFPSTARNDYTLAKDREVRFYAPCTTNNFFAVHFCTMLLNIKHYPWNFEGLALSASLQKDHIKYYLSHFRFWMPSIVCLCSLGCV